MIVAYSKCCVCYRFYLLLAQPLQEWRSVHLITGRLILQVSRAFLSQIHQVYCACVLNKLVLSPYFRRMSEVLLKRATVALDDVYIKSLEVSPPNHTSLANEKIVSNSEICCYFRFKADA